MDVYHLTPADGFECICPIDFEAWFVFSPFKGSSLRESWRPVRMRIIRTDGLCAERIPGDLVWMGFDPPVFNRRACDALRDILERNGELLRLDCDEGVYHAYNVMRLIPALDEKKSNTVRLPGGGVVVLSSPVLYYDKVQGAEIFKLAEAPSGNVYVGESFVKRVEDCKLRGFDFKKVGFSGRK